MTKLRELSNQISKGKIVVIVLFALSFSLVKCSTVQYQSACVPQLNYDLPIGTPFTLMNFRDYPKEYIINKGLKADIVFQEPEGNALDTVGNNTKFIKTSLLRLLGPVLYYIKSPYNPFDNSVVYFYVEIEGKHSWITGAGLINLSSNFANNENKLNQKIVREYIFYPTVNKNTLICFEENHAYLPNET